MEPEVLRIVEAVLLDPTVGANAQIDALELDTPNGSDTPDARPAHVTIRNAVDDDLTVREREETDFPLVLVEFAPRLPTGWGQVWSGVRDFELDLRVAYLVKSSDIAQNTRDSSYTLRALVRALDRGLFGPGKADTAGKRNGFCITNCVRLTYGTANQPHDSGVMAGAVDFTVTVRNLTP